MILHLSVQLAWNPPAGEIKCRQESNIHQPVCVQHVHKTSSNHRRTWSAQVFRWRWCIWTGFRPGCSSSAYLQVNTKRGTNQLRYSKSGHFRAPGGPRSVSHSVPVRSRDIIRLLLAASSAEISPTFLVWSQFCYYLFRFFFFLYFFGIFWWDSRRGRQETGRGRERGSDT